MSFLKIDENLYYDYVNHTLDWIKKRKSEKIMQQLRKRLSITTLDNFLKRDD